MARTNRDRISLALDQLKAGLEPFVERELKARLGADWLRIVNQGLQRQLERGPRGDVSWDNPALLFVVHDHWNDVFKAVLSPGHRSMANELRNVRNELAHDRPFNFDQTYRAINTVRLLLEAVSAAEQAREAHRIEQELMRTRFAEEARTETRRAASIEGQPQAGLRPWREVVTPHRDVSSGNYRQAEFAADLDQVHRGEGEAEYRDPKEFFRRTFLTRGLSELLTGALQRLSGKGGDPVVQLRTNFGGGKTHSMLALYHLFAGGVAADFAGMEGVLDAAGVEKAPKAQRAVLVGTALSPGQLATKPDGTKVKTLWGELAWQLGGKKGFARVAEADANGTSPGSQVLVELFRACEPCLVLIDEWVAFARQLYKVEGLPAGTFDANLSFAQSLTEAAKVCQRTLVVASLPSSQIENGGDGGEAALERLEQTFGRMEATWKPASTDEGFEIVRRRLFEPIQDTKLHAARDAVIRAFSDFYRSQAQEFPTGVAEADYRRRLELAYPIHPEIFDRLYGDWSTLDKFQRTRGVLRLMADVIHALWTRDDRNLLILPATVPIDDPGVQYELTRHLDDGWDGVIGRDVDGPNALPGKLDTNPNFGRYAAARRVARTIFFGTAPTANAAHPGIEPRSVHLGCVQPGETVATFGDALRRLSNDSTYLYIDGARHWYSTQPSVTQLAKERAADFRDDVVQAEITRRLRADRGRGQFAGVHVAPESSAEIPDEPEARLVVLGPEQPHTRKAPDSPARRFATDALARRGSAPRLLQNGLVFVAPEQKALETVEAATRQYLAWKGIAEEHETLNLTAFSKKQAESKRDEADKTIQARIPEAWSAILVPAQPEATSPAIEWRELAPKGEGSLADRVANRLVNEEYLFVELGAGRLKLELDRNLWKGVDHLSTKKLADYLASYLYLPRIRDQRVLEAGIRSGGMLLDPFAYADAYDEALGGYRGMRAPGAGTVAIDSASLLVKPEAAKAWLELEAGARPQPGGPSVSGPLGGADIIDGERPTYPQPIGGDTRPPAAPVRRFHGSVELNRERMVKHAGDVVNEVVQHLQNQPGARVKVTIEIEAELPQGASDQVQRVVTENCSALKFKSQGFERE